MANPWDNDPIIGSADAANALGRPVIVQGPKPVEPKKELKGNYVVDLNSGTAAQVPGLPADQSSKNTYAPMSHDDKVSAGLDPSLPFYKGSDGLPTLPGGAKAGVAPVDPEMARAHVSDILSQIDNAKKLLGAPLTTGLPGSLFGHIPGTNAYTLRSLIGDTNDPNNPGQITGDLRQQGIAYLRALNGGGGVGTVARSQQEQQALQSAMSNIRQGLPADQLGSALDNVGQIYRRALARSYGMAPESPEAQAKFGINPLWQPEGGYPAEAQQPKANALPALAPVSASTTSQAVVDPKLAAIAPQLTAYLNADPKKVSNAMIIGFMQKNGVDPTATNTMQLLQMRATGKYKGFTVDPRSNVPLTGIDKTRAEVSDSPLGALAAGAADAATLGAVPDVVGAVHAVTGAGPSRSDFITKRDALASAQPGATVAGNLLGSISPLGGAGEAGAMARLGRTAGAGGAYGFFGSDDPNIESRLYNAGLGATIGAATHGAVDVGGRAVQSVSRAAARPISSVLAGPEATADKYALGAAARKLPLQNLDEVKSADAAATNAGVPQPAAVSINRGGQDTLARIAAGSPAARAVVDNVAQNTHAAIPQQLAGDFNDAITAASPRGVSASTYLNRPVRDISSDIQSMAGREFERGIDPIKSERLELTPELASDMEHERVAGAVRDALANHSLSDETRSELRALVPQFKTLSNAPEIARDAYAKGISLSVDGARNIATALDRTAGKLMDGSEGQVEMSRLSRDIRGSIADQFPEYAPVNERYASRMRGKEALYAARQNFLASTPDGQDALAKSAKNFTDTPNDAEYGAEPKVGPSGFTTPAPPMPSNRQLAMTGAREAASVKAGESGPATASRIANNPNQAGNNATVLGSQAPAVQAKAGVRANIANTVDRIASGSSADQTEGWFNLVKKAAALKATGGSSHYLLAHAASSLPGMSSQDAARVVGLYLNADAAPQVLQSLSSAYGARRARFIMARMAAVTSAATGVRGFTSKGP